MCFCGSQVKKSITSHLCTVSDFAIEMFDVLDAINYQSYNDFVLRVGEWKDTQHMHTHIQTLVSELLTYCTGHHLRSVPVSLEGNASQKEHSLQEARHRETWSSGFHCVGYPVGNLLQEPLFNPSVAWCIQCHPVYRLWGSMFVCLTEPSLQKRNFW